MVKLPNPLAADHTSTQPYPLKLIGALSWSENSLKYEQLGVISYLFTNAMRKSDRVTFFFVIRAYMQKKMGHFLKLKVTVTFEVTVTWESTSPLLWVKLPAMNFCLSLWLSNPCPSHHVDQAPDSTAQRVPEHAACSTVEVREK